MKKSFDLEERTLKFAKMVLVFVRRMAKTEENKILIRQMVRSGTSVGANYLEANDADSKKDFIHKIRISRREAKETSYWLKLIVFVNNSLQKFIEPLQQEAKELNLIFSKIIKSSIAGK